jgi:diaminopimelate decarboxylase
MMRAEKVSSQAVQQALQTRSLVLPLEALERHVEGYFADRQRYLDIIALHPPPLYILQTQILEERCRQFQDAFRKVLPEVGFYFAVKSNNYPEVSRIVLEKGFGLDVSSGAELQMALYLEAQDIIFSGPGKTGSELVQAAVNADRTVVLVDSFHELDRLQEAASSVQRRVRAGVRVSIDPTGLWRKFGIRLEDLPAFQQKASTCDSIDLQGVQFHASWNLDPGRQVGFIEKLGRSLSAMPADFLQKLQFVDIGGGYWPSQGEWLQEAGTPAGMVLKAACAPVNSPMGHFWNAAQSIDSFAAQLAAAIRSHIFPVTDCRICLEPGRWICNDSMQLLLSVVDKKAADLAITDAGTNAVGWERFETDYFPVLNLTRPGMQENPCTLFGSLCTPHDVWGYSYWGTGLEEGDILLIPMQGAYTYSLRQDFIKPLPQVVTI